MVRYNQHTTGRQVVQENLDKLDGKIIAITGPSKGTIGGTLLTDLAAAKPSKIFLMGRSLDKVQPVIDTFKQENTQTELIFVQADLDDLESMRRAGDEVLSKTDKLDILFNNAGVMATPYQKTKQGHEWQFGINHLAHFVLTAKLMPLVEAAAPGSAIINTSSTACEMCGVPYDDLLYSNGSTYNPWVAYAASKTANAQFIVQLHKKYNSVKGIKFFAHQPGMVQTNIADHLPATGPDSIAGVLENSPVDFSGDVKPLAASTSTMLAAAIDPELERYSGGFLRNCDVYQPKEWVLDPEGAEKLWKISEGLTGVKW